MDKKMNDKKMNDKKMNKKIVLNILSRELTNIS